MARRILAGIVFLSVFLAVGTGLHYYLAQRLVLDPDWPPGVRSAGLALLGAGFASVIAQAFVRRRLGRLWTRLSWVSYSWLGASFLLFSATVVSDAVLWLLGAAAPGGAADGVALARGQALLVGGVGAAASAVALRQGRRPPSVRRVEVPLERWPRALDGFRIAQISDVHIGPLLDGRFAAVVTERVNALEPDLVAVTGDLVDGRVAHIGEEVEPFGALRARHGVYFVTGNHDYYSGARDWVARVQQLGWRALRNERIAIGEASGGFDLAGVDDRHGSLMGSGEGEDLERALADRDPQRPVVLLAHDPGSFKDASRRGVDLQLSGHTHGGQLWPFRYFVRLAVPWIAGLYRVGRSALYVSCGTGFWGPPMRLGAPAEITELTLRSR